MSITRPPQVTLSADNIARLRTYPRPPRDNGIGLHFHVDLTPELIQRTVTNLKSIRATWTMIFAADEQLAERAALACFRAGIMPVVRIAKLIDEPFDPAPYVHALRRALGASDFPHDPARPPLYVQIYNEPEDWREWMPHEKPPGWQKPSNWPEIFGRNWAHQAVRVYDAGGYPGIQTLDRDGFDVAVDAIAAMNRTDIWQRAFFAHHNYGENHPPDYPYDARNQQDHPGRTILDDYICALKFLAHASWMQERLGFVLPLIGGEGGWLPGAEEDRRYPKVEPPLHARYTVEMFQWLRTGALSNGEPLPDYLFSITAWIAGSWTFQGQNWWDNPLFPDGKLTQTIEAMQAIEPFERRFSWQGSSPPAPEPPDPPPTPVVPTPPPTPVVPTPPPAPLPALRKGDWIEPFNIQVVRNENRPDRPQGDIVYRLVDLWTTRDGSWDPNLDVPGRLPAWARDTYLRPFGAPDYFDDAGGDHHLFARVLDVDGNPIASPDLVMLWSDGLHQLGDPGYRGYVHITPKSHSGWANQDIYARYDHTRGERGPWCWCPAGAADVVTGGGLPGMGWHVSTFAVWRAERRQAVAPPPTPPTPTPPPAPPTPPEPAPTPPPDPTPPPSGDALLEAIRRNAWDTLQIPFNPDAAIGRYARANNLGVPMTGEFDVAGHRCQGFAGGIVYVPIGQWDQVKHIAW
jgi:hypothetical protein